MSQASINNMNKIIRLLFEPFVSMTFVILQVKSVLNIHEYNITFYHIPEIKSKPPKDTLVQRYVSAMVRNL
jgi:hypothetical protein